MQAYPDPIFGHLSVTAAGGHPGAKPEHASIRRWTAPSAGVVRIDGTLGHAAENGDGVRGRVVSSVRGKLGEWVVRHATEKTPLAKVRVEAGETLDFIVDAMGSSTSDSYTWAPNISYVGKAAKATPRTWNARKDFDAPGAKPVRLTRWEELAQVLLLSNELAFVD
jgi:hypothetical protein